MNLDSKRLKEIIWEEVKSFIVEKSKSQSQQRLFGMALSVKRGEQDISDLPDTVQDDVQGIVDNMSEDEIEDYASTKHKGLPDKVKNN